MESTFRKAQKVVSELIDHVFRRKARMAAKIFLERLKIDVSQEFDKQTDPVTGQAWPQRKRGGNWPLLNKTGRMKAAVLSCLSQLPKERGDGVVVELVDKIALFHQFGTRKMPRRRFFGITPESQKKVAKWCADEVVRLSVKARK